MTLRPLHEIAAGDEEAVRTLIAQGCRPAVLRGLVAGWPCVREAGASTRALAAYLSRLDSGASVDAIMTRPGAGSSTTRP